jgi:hypothetical protein
LIASLELNLALGRVIRNIEEILPDFDESEEPDEEKSGSTKEELRREAKGQGS